MNDCSLIYYTSNREDPAFEKKIQENILKNSGDMPIISVSQKPIDFGENIVVGDVGVSGFNCFRQILLACEAAKTTWVISAEADCLYPPDYFTFRPERDDVCYRNSNLYVMGHKRDYFYHKGKGATHAQIIGREFYIKRLKGLFEGAPMWSIEEKNFPKERHKRSDVINAVIHYQTENPVIQIKTGDGMRHYTQSDRTPVYELPYWGNGQDVINFFK